MVRRRHLDYATRWGTWRHLVRRTVWAPTQRSAPRAASPTWPVAPETRERMTIEWPNRYRSPNASSRIDPLKHAVAGYIPLRQLDIPQPEGSVILFRVSDGSRTLKVVIDYCDAMTLDDSVGDADLYFKMQYMRGGYDNPIVRPGGYVSNHLALYRYARRWRRLRDSSTPSFDVLGRFGMSWARTIRGNAIGLLQDQDRFDFQGGTATILWGEHMDEIARAQVCLDLPGHGEFCHRLVEYLGVGACVIGPELKTEMPVPLESGVHHVRVPRTLDGLVDSCEKLLNDRDLRDEIRRGAEDYFDRYLALDQLGGYYVDACWRALSA